MVNIFQLPATNFLRMAVLRGPVHSLTARGGCDTLEPSPVTRTPAKTGVLMPFLLQVVAGPHKGRCFLVEEGAPLLLGRSRHAETRLEDPGVSRVHCEIELEDGQVLVTDLDSAGGTFVNGQRITEQQLRPGDVVQIGSTKMRLVPAGAPAVDDDAIERPAAFGVDATLPRTVSGTAQRADRTNCYLTTGSANRSAAASRGWSSRPRTSRTIAR